VLKAHLNVIPSPSNARQRRRFPGSVGFFQVARAIYGYLG